MVWPVSGTVAGIAATIMVRLGMLSHKAFVIFDRYDGSCAKVLECMRRAVDDSTPYNVCSNTSLPTRNGVMGNNENNSQLTQLLCTFTTSDVVEPVCCQDCMERHDEVDIMLTSHILHAVREVTQRVRILREDTYVFVFWYADPGKLMWKQMSSSKTGMAPFSVITDQPQILSGALCSEEITDIRRSSMCCLHNKA